MISPLPQDMYYLVCSRLNQFKTYKDMCNICSLECKSWLILFIIPDMCLVFADNYIVFADNHYVFAIRICG